MEKSPLKVIPSDRKASESKDGSKAMLDDIDALDLTLAINQVQAREKKLKADLKSLAQDKFSLERSLKEEMDRAQKVEEHLKEELNLIRQGLHAKDAQLKSLSQTKDALLRREKNEQLYLRDQLQSAYQKIESITTQYNELYLYCENALKTSQQRQQDTESRLKQTHDTALKYAQQIQELKPRFEELRRREELLSHEKHAIDRRLQDLALDQKERITKAHHSDQTIDNLKKELAQAQIQLARFAVSSESVEARMKELSAKELESGHSGSLVRDQLRRSVRVFKEIGRSLGSFFDETTMPKIPALKIKGARLLLEQIRTEADTLARLEVRLKEGADKAAEET